MLHKITKSMATDLQMWFLSSQCI